MNCLIDMMSRAYSPLIRRLQQRAGWLAGVGRDVGGVVCGCDGDGGSRQDPSWAWTRWWTPPRGMAIKDKTGSTYLP